MEGGSGSIVRMKALLVLVVVVFHLAASAAPEIQVFFSPDGGCTAAVTSELAKAKKTVLVQAYSFTSAPIAKAVVDAHKRGVKVTVILDKSQRSQEYASADFLKNAEVKTYIDGKHAIAHNKVMVVDG
jgi:phosphatidylserine/phosphatidylglycerophosphate/cardiolipin synthase-like enzyme